MPYSVADGRMMPCGHLLTQRWHAVQWLRKLSRDDAPGGTTVFFLAGDLPSVIVFAAESAFAASVPATAACRNAVEAHHAESHVDSVVFRVDARGLAFSLAAPASDAERCVDLYAHHRFAAGERQCGADGAHRVAECASATECQCADGDKCDAANGDAYG